MPRNLLDRFAIFMILVGRNSARYKSVIFRDFRSAKLPSQTFANRKNFQPQGKTPKKNVFRLFNHCQKKDFLLCKLVMKSELIHVRSSPPHTGLHRTAGAQQEVGTEFFWVFSGIGKGVCVCACPFFGENNQLWKKVMNGKRMKFSLCFA